MLKKIVSLVVGATLVLATLGVAAANIATESVYGPDDTISVVTTVSDANPGEVYTYLAFSGNLEDLDNNAVVYVDEKVVADEANSVEFRYSTAAANLGATILVGDDGVSNDKATENEIAIEEDNSLAYTVQVGANAAEEKTLEVEGLAGTDFVTIAADLSNVVVSGVTLNGAPFENYFVTNAGLYLPLSAISELEEVAFVIDTEAGAIDKAITIIDGGYIANDTEDANGYASVLAVAKVEGAAAAYGIEFSADKDDFSAAVTTVALGKGTDGMFAVKLYGYDQNDSGLAGAETVYARAYADDVISEGICVIRIAE